MQQKSNQPISSSPKHNNIVLSIVVLGTLMGALDSTIVLLAFPVINNNLNSILATSLWIILAYLLVLAVATTQMVIAGVLSYIRGMDIRKQAPDKS